jgi:hypothetical protein
MIKDRPLCNDEYPLICIKSLRHINPEKLIAIGRALTQMASITS